jgi:hypothetical protein
MTPHPFQMIEINWEDGLQKLIFSMSKRILEYYGPVIYNELEGKMPQRMDNFHFSSCEI